MRLLFCGTPEFGLPTLKHLRSQPDFQLLAVISQPDRPRGRGQELSFSPVKSAALEAGLPVYQPEKIRSREAQEFIESMAPDAVVIIAYGQLIPSPLLGIPKYGWINLHSSLLPRYRGAAPIQWAIARGEVRTGLTTMRIDSGMDTGDILLQQELDIGPAETVPELSLRLSELGAPLLTETLRGLASGTVLPRPQNQALATTAPLLTKQDGRIDWNLTAVEVSNRMRGFAPWPGAYSCFRGQTWHLWGEPLGQMEPSLAEKMVRAAPGEILQQGRALFVLCGGTTLLSLRSVKREGRKLVSASEFASGAHLKPGESFVSP